MTKLSVNINKIATLRNARGGSIPNVLKMATDIESFGAQGITVHPRPDERHIRYRDVFDLSKIISTELNVEGNPIPSFIDLVLKAKPTQVTLVPDAEDAITSNAGWDTIKHTTFLKEIIQIFKKASIRTSIFVDPEVKIIEAAAAISPDRIELYTEAYAKQYLKNPKKAIQYYLLASEKADELGLGINAGHDLNLENIGYFSKNIPNILEVSIGHALICEALYFGLENVIAIYLKKINSK